MFAAVCLSSSLGAFSFFLFHLAPSTVTVFRDAGFSIGVVSVGGCLTDGNWILFYFILFVRAVNDFDFNLFTNQRGVRNRANTRGVERTQPTTSDKLWGMVRLFLFSHPLRAHELTELTVNVFQ